VPPRVMRWYEHDRLSGGAATGHRAGHVSMSDGTLQSAFEKERPADALPAGLPLAHVTAQRWLEKILDAGELQPRSCTVFEKDLLYFSYGGLFYRKRLQTEMTTELPIGLVFSPSILKSITSLFPFDTGAMESNADFAAWKAQFDPFKTRFRISTTDAVKDAATLVRLLYEDNANYLRGNVAGGVETRTDPLPLLASFLAANMTPHVDHRQRSIECLTETAVSLGQHLEWIGFPMLNVDRVLSKIYACTAPRMPDFWTYEYTRNFNPGELTAQLETRGRDAAIGRYVDLKP
jgi:hypothetical protein